MPPYDWENLTQNVPRYKARTRPVDNGGNMGARPAPGPRTRIDEADGRPMAVLWNYAIHGTTLRADGRCLPADVTKR